MSHLIYLRKSRADMEAELKGEGETLARHEKILLEYAKKQNLIIGGIYKEIVSGETIAARPIMQQLLSEVEKGTWDGVVVMEVERLARGDTIDQGIVAQAFKYSNTKIITPAKTYDPNNEFDEEYFEFGLFMSRREYKTINRRLQSGRLASVKEGKWVGNKSPFGYERVKIVGDKGYMLKVVPSEAEAVKIIYELYINGEKQDNGSTIQIGSTKIANYLNQRNVKSAGEHWTTQSVSTILRNPVYMGKVKWGARPQEKHVIDGVVVLSRPRKPLEDITLVDGLHDSIISEEQWTKAQQIMSTQAMHRTPVSYTTTNPLSGIIICSKCGKKMVRRSYLNNTPDGIMCPNNKCNNASSQLHLIEKCVLDALNLHLSIFKAETKKNKSTLVQSTANQENLKNNMLELDKINKQLSSLHDFLEQGVYDIDTFLKRSQTLNDKVNLILNSNKILENDIRKDTTQKEMRDTIIPRIEYVLKTYPTLEDTAQKNKLLKEVIEKATYEKQVGGRWKVAVDDFKVHLYVKL